MRVLAQLADGEFPTMVLETSTIAGRSRLYHHGGPACGWSVVGVVLGASLDVGFTRILIVIEGMVEGFLTATEWSITNICNRFLAWERRVASRL